MYRLHLVAASDDYLLELSLRRLLGELAGELGVTEPQRLAPETTPEELAVEICTPSLFDPQRLLVLEDVRGWLDAPAPADAPKLHAVGELAPLLATLDQGLPPDVTVVLGAWCGRKPKGELITRVEAQGSFRWIPLPPTPKPWEDLTLSPEQRQLLHGVLVEHAAGTSFSPRAEALLLERLGFAPRLLAAEVDKLVTGAGERGTVDEELVRQLTFPRERSLEVVREAVLERNPRAIFDLLSAASQGIPVRDWQGRPVDPGGLAIILLGQIGRLLEQLLYLRRLAAAHLPGELDPVRCAPRSWYNQVFKTRLAPILEKELKGAGPSPLTASAKAPSTWTLGQLFRAASCYPEPLLLAALTSAGPLERQLRGPSAPAAFSAWLAIFVDHGRQGTIAP